MPFTFNKSYWYAASRENCYLAPLAIMTAENLERPRWVRRLERLLPRRLSASGGIMQQEGARNDLHSIELAFERYLPTWQDVVTDPWPPLSVFERYNLSEEFQSLAVGAFEMLETNPSLLAALDPPVREADPTAREANHGT